MQIKVTGKNLDVGNALRAHVEDRDFQFLYNDGDGFHFMNTETYDQIAVQEDVIGDQAPFLQENMTVKLSMHEMNPVAITLPQRVTLEVVETDPGLKGDTSGGGGKPATLETGAVVRVPLFVQIGETIKVNTRTGEYLSRA